MNAKKTVFRAQSVCLLFVQVFVINVKQVVVRGVPVDAEGLSEVKKMMMMMMTTTMAVM